MRRDGGEKPPKPEILEILKKYGEIRDKLQKNLLGIGSESIRGQETVSIYGIIFNSVHQPIVDRSSTNYEKIEETYRKQFMEDAMKFMNQLRNKFREIQVIDISAQIQLTYSIIQLYLRFMNWMQTIFASIERHSMNAKGIYFQNESLKILRENFILQEIEILFKICIQGLELFKRGELNRREPLQEIIKTIGYCGFKSPKNVLLCRENDRFFYVSKDKDKKEIIEIELETDFFKKHFVCKLIDFLQDSYRKVAKDLIELPASDYIKRALEILQKEEEAADIFCPAKGVRQLVIRAIEEVLIHEHGDIIIKKSTGLSNMIENEEINNLKDLYRLFGRSPLSQKSFIKHFMNYVEQKGSYELDQVTPEDEANVRSKAVFELIDSLYKFWEKISGIAMLLPKKNEGEVRKERNEKKNENTIESETGAGLQLQSNIGLAFQQVCNKNQKVTNFLAYYADLKLKETNIVIGEDLTQKIVKLSKFLYSYDAFLKLYQKLLGLRILYDNFKYKDEEIEIINALKNQAGVAALTNITTMINDLHFSESHQIPADSLSFTLKVLVLTSVAWQFPKTNPSIQRFPPQLVKVMSFYEKIFAQWMPDRLITWVMSHGRAILHAKFQDSDHLLIVNTYQMLILTYLQTINFRPIMIAEIFSELALDDQSAFNSSILMLVKTGILLKNGNPEKIQSRNEKIEFNIRFRYKTPKAKIGCFRQPKFIEKPTAANQELLQERSNLIDALIVKIMKAKRVMQYSQLILQVQKICKIFKAEVPLIKKRIEHCHHKEYLTRDEQDINTLYYKP